MTRTGWQLPNTDSFPVALTGTKDGHPWKGYLDSLRLADRGVWLATWKVEGSE